ncbi:MAG: Stk1 family PASTA domain-containing Ser/Thr kinase [Lachnospiraceae bacterium]|nr:Stk1 family PASTA domain-containing Ser/Thr kinase [Lachnospiraceae bacterium]
MLKVGMFIQNRYEIISRIGSGGMADVYKAKDHKLNRFVAVKVLKNEFRDDKSFVSKFRVEAQSAAGLAHANIVNIYDVGEEAGIYYIVMELVEGITLKGYIEKKGRLSVREATSIALQISAGLEAAHNNGIIHRDVKPQNIIISTDGKVKVADFGIARASNSNTINSSVMGSVHYSSPEQSRGGYSDEKSDIYSLGITMYEMLTGHVPFDGDTAVSVAIKHLQEELHGPKELVPEVPNSTNQIVIKCTQKSPDRRYSNMSELIRDLRESLVNPDGDFVTQQVVDNKSQTIIMSKEQVNRINAERSNMPSYDESLDVGAAAGLRGHNPHEEENRAYQPGSYYQKSGYQEVVTPGRNENGGSDRWDSDYDPSDSDDHDDYNSYYDVYDDRDNYGFQEADYKLDESYSDQDKDRKDGDDIGINPRLEKAVTVGGIIVAVIIGCVFLSLLANAFGLLNFSKRDRKTTKSTEKITEKVVEKSTEKKDDAEKTSEKTTDAPDEKNTEAPVVKQVEVPSLLGKTEEEVQAALREKGLSGSRGQDASSAEYEVGKVCSQTPVAGTMVDEGTQITYQINSSSGEIILSDLTNIEQSQAQAFLLTQGLQYKIDETQYSDTIDTGYVIRTEPAANTALHEGDTVTLYISQGSQAEVSYVTVPDFWYCDQEISTQRAELTGLGTPVFEYEPSNEVNKDWVARQSIEAGTEVPEGTVITLYLSSGPAPAGVDTQDNITVENGSEGKWECNAKLDPPSGYTGQKVRIDLVQEGVTTTIFTGETTFPYLLKVQGAPGVTTGTAYVYLLNDQGETESKIEYPGIIFNQVN